jgi:putative cell wall-binding protein
MAVAAAATVATTAGLLPLAATGAGAAANFDLTRLAGANRYDTAEEISKATFPTATDVVVTTGENFPDALSGNYLAGIRSAPILLTTRNSVPAETQAEVNRLNPQRVWVLGGTDAVGAGGVPTTSATVNRIAGATRYETAAAAGSTGTVGTVGGKPTAIIATGDKFADALSAGPGAYAGNFPLFLTPGAPASTLHPATKSALTSRGITNVILMGGTAAISAAVQSELQGMGITVTRVEGADRTETARNFAEWLLANLGFVNTHMNVARGDLFPDALAGGPHAGKDKAPILLTWTPTEASPGNNANLGALKYAADHKATLTGGHIFGGILAVSQAAEQAIEAAGGAVAGAGTTTRPELVAAAVVGTVTSGVNAGTTVKYTFDEAVTCANAGLFWAIQSDNTRNSGASCSAVSGDANSINVLFTGITSTTTAATLTLATVDEGAATDVSGDANPEGDAGLNSASSQPLAAGSTNAPDLQTVTVGGSAAPGDPNSTFVTFKFDEIVAAVNNNTGFHVITTDNDDVVCTLDSGVGTDTLVVLCDNASVTGGSATTPFTAAAIARGTVDSGAVQDATATTNPLEAADVTAGNNLGAPNLLSATFNLSATDTGGNPIDTATLVFNQAISDGGNCAAFQAYFVNGSELDPASCTFQASTPNQVLLSFANGALTGAVGVSVDDGAVVAASGANIGDANEQDEVGVANTSPAQTAGNSAAPELVSVTKAAATDAFGNPTGGTKYTYTFDEDVDATTVNPALFFVYLADGTKLVANSCTGSELDASDATVVCTDYETVVGGVNVSDTVEASGVLGTVDNGAVVADADTGAEPNNEGAASVS